jgi:hypothetical protein
VNETIKVEINLETDQITRFSIFLTRNLDPPLIIVGVEDGVPADYDINTYDYIASTPGVYNSGNFRLKTQPMQTINFEKRSQNVQSMNEYMASFVALNQLTQANFDLFLSDSASFVQQYLGGGGRLITWIETVNRNGFNATTTGFKTRTGYRGSTSNGVEGVNGNYVRANTILGFLNDL